MSTPTTGAAFRIRGACRRCRLVVLGFEGAGRVEDVGPGAGDFATGDRVAYALPPHGAYSRVRVYPAEKPLRVPASLGHLDDSIRAASMLKGLAVQYLVRRTHRLLPGEAALVPAAAGATGLPLCQWASYPDFANSALEEMITH